MSDRCCCCCLLRCGATGTLLGYSLVFVITPFPGNEARCAIHSPLQIDPLRLCRCACLPSPQPDPRVPIAVSLVCCGALGVVLDRHPALRLVRSACCRLLWRVLFRATLPVLRARLNQSRRSLLSDLLSVQLCHTSCPLDSFHSAELLQLTLSAVSLCAAARSSRSWATWPSCWSSARCCSRRTGVATFILFNALASLHSFALLSFVTSSLCGLLGGSMACLLAAALLVARSG